MYITEFTVQGSWRFPLDMLRYDSCFPASQDAVVALDEAISTRQGGIKVRLMTMHKSAKPNITPDRWASFGWMVSDVTTRKHG